MVPKSDGCSVLKQNGVANESTKVCGTKRPQPECLINSPRQETPIRNNGNIPHLVYVRRKPESKQHKSSKSKDVPIKLCEHDEKNHEQSPMKEKDPTIHNPKPVPEPETSEGVSSALPSVTIDSGKSNIISLVADSKCHQLDYPKRSSVGHWEERFFLLQNFLKVLDESTQDDYRRMLRSLSSVDLSRLAVELERRTIQLSSEEAKEVQRAKALDVQGINK